MDIDKKSEPLEPVDDIQTRPMPVNALEGSNGEVVPVLIVIAGPQIGQVFQLRIKNAKLGRADDADVSIRDTSISRYHAEIYLDDLFSCHIKDLESTNGTLVNGTRVSEAVLAAGDRIQLGRSTIIKLEYHGRIEDEFHSQLYEAGTRDPLTGVFNRRYLDQHIEADFRLAVRHQQKLSILLIDVDHFKKVNDTYGHLAGDTVLRTISQALAKRLRTEDILARYGGEEFVVLLRNTSTPGAVAVAESVRELVADTDIRYRDASIHVTISIGVATFVGNAEITMCTELLNGADKALYRAKEAGRNRVEVARTEDFHKV